MIHLKELIKEKRVDKNISKNYDFQLTSITKKILKLMYKN
ncbi:hypothetical protein GM3708_1333 [Geminocystis sp. NIES-3708]|nr:hypothetical protein GM3708_1333 [Geminocystis sp. NIES-3708]